MQNLTAAPRDALTADQVTYLLRDSSSVDIERGLEVLDLNLAVVEDISDDFLGGTVTRNNQATIHGTCTLTIARDVDYGNQLLRPYLTLTADGVSARFNGGVFVPRKPQTAYGASLLSNAVTGSDRLLQLNRPVGDAYNVPSGANYLTAIRQVFIDSGVTASNVLIDTTASALEVPAPGRSWPLLAPTTPSASTAPVDAVAGTSNATTWLQIVNDLLGSINYRGVWVDADGLFRCDRYLDPAQRPVEFSLDYDDPLRNIIATSRTMTRDVSQVPNVWIFQRQNMTDAGGSPVEPVEGAGQYTVTNQSDGDTSIDARGGGQIGRYVSVVPLNAADQATLVSLGDRQVASDKQVATTWTVATSPLPAAWHEDVYSYHDDEAAGDVKVLSTGWTLDYGNSRTPPADQTHTWQLVQ